MRIHVTGEAPHLTVTGNQPGRIVEVGVGSVFAVNGKTGAVTIQGITDAINVTLAPYHADPTGTTDATTALQAALHDCPRGGTVYLPAGTYTTSSPLDLPPGITLRGPHATLMTGPGMNPADYPACIRPASSFDGDAVLKIIGDNDGTHPDISAEQRITHLTLDGSLLGGSSIDGLYAQGNAQNVVLDDVCIRQTPNNGIVTASRGDGTYPFSWRLRHVVIDNCHANGLLLTGCTDLTLHDVQAIGCWGQGFVIDSCPNAVLTACRAEWNGSHGYHITGDWGDWAGSGGMQITGCQTDRNNQHGMLIDATGNAPILITGLQTRRDGRNGGDGGSDYAGLAIHDATVPVTITGLTCYPGVDDDGNATNSPQYGVSLSGAATVLLDSAYLHADTAGIHDDETSTTVLYGTNIVTAAGDTTTTTRTPHAP